MAKVSMNLQDSFLNAARRQNALVTIVLTDGSELKGKVSGFDNFTVIIDVGKVQHLVYKHAIGTIFPDKPLERKAPNSRPIEPYTAKSIPNGSNATKSISVPDTANVTPEKIEEFKKIMEGQKTT